MGLRHSTFLLELKNIMDNHINRFEQFDGELAGATFEVASDEEIREYPIYLSRLIRHSERFAEFFANLAIGREVDLRYVISDVEAQTFEALIGYAYRNELPRLKSIREVYPASKLYQMEELSRICEQMLGESISDENCVDMFLYADALYEEDLQLLAFKGFLGSPSIDIHEVIVRMYNSERSAAMKLAAMMNYCLDNGGIGKEFFTTWYGSALDPYEP